MSGVVSFLDLFVGAGTTVVVDPDELDKFNTEEMSSSEVGAEYPVVYSAIAQLTADNL